MERNVFVSRQRIDGFDVSSSDSAKAQVLVVDDSLINRKVIEQLLKISSFKVTPVDSRRRALQFLGQNEDKSSSVGFDLKMLKKNGGRRVQPFWHVFKAKIFVICVFKIVVGSLAFVGLLSLVFMVFGSLKFQLYIRPSSRSGKNLIEREGTKLKSGREKEAK